MPAPVSFLLFAAICGGHGFKFVAKVVPWITCIVIRPAMNRHREGVAIQLGPLA